jgi:hypothetical protein
LSTIITLSPDFLNHNRTVRILPHKLSTSKRWMSLMFDDTDNMFVGMKMLTLSSNICTTAASKSQRLTKSPVLVLAVVIRARSAVDGEADIMFEDGLACPLS